MGTEKNFATCVLIQGKITGGGGMGLQVSYTIYSASYKQVRISLHLNPWYPVLVTGIAIGSDVRSRDRKEKWGEHPLELGEIDSPTCPDILNQKWVGPQQFFLTVLQKNLVKCTDTIYYLEHTVPPVFLSVMGMWVFSAQGKNHLGRSGVTSKSHAKLTL